MRNFIAFGILIFSFFACESGKEKENQQVDIPIRIVSLNGTITEILFALNLGQQVVGVDVTSVYPVETSKLLQLGHVTQLNMESLIGLKPSHVLAFQEDLNPQLEKQLKDANIVCIAMNKSKSIKETKALIKDIAANFNKIQEAQKLSAEILDEALKIQKLPKQQSVLFIYARGAGNLMVGGEDTPVEAVIELAGGSNAAKGFEGYKPLTTEALTTFDPDVILMFDSGAQSLGPNGIWTVPGMSLTKAGKAKKLITMDGLLLSGFGPRVGQAIQQLNKALSK
jgi:iron complex transport system substrate-binding protein